MPDSPGLFTLGPPFIYYSAYFNGTDAATRGAGLSGAADSKLGLVSFWLKMAATSGDTTDYSIFGSSGATFEITRQAAGQIRILTRNSGGTLVSWVDSIGHATMLKADGWAHWIAAWDTGTAGRGYLFKNGADVTNLDTLSPDLLVDYTVSDWVFGGGGGPDFLLSEFYMTVPSTYFDLTVSSNVQKFRSTGGAPVDLGSSGSIPTGTAPLVYMHNQIGGTPSWFTNQGTGGNFSTLSGTITDGGADKP